MTNERPPTLSDMSWQSAIIWFVVLFVAFLAVNDMFVDDASIDYPLRLILFTIPYIGAPFIVGLILWLPFKIIDWFSKSKDIAPSLLVTCLSATSIWMLMLLWYHLHLKNYT